MRRVGEYIIWRKNDNAKHYLISKLALPNFSAPNCQFLPMVSNCPWCQIVRGVPHPLFSQERFKSCTLFHNCNGNAFYDGGALIFLWFRVSFDDVKVKEVVCICFRGFLWASSNFWKWESTKPIFLKKEGFSGFLLNNIYAFLFFSWARHYVRMNLSSVQFHFLCQAGGSAILCMWLCQHLCICVLHILAHKYTFY